MPSRSVSGDHWTEAQTISGLGEASHHLVNDFAEAARCWQAWLTLQRAHADEFGTIATLAALSMNARYQGLISIHCSDHYVLAVAPRISRTAGMFRNVARSWRSPICSAM
jgi:hypothetical protein